MTSWRRLWAVVLKELRQLRRDRISMLLIVAIPVIDLLLFGYAINFNPRNLDAMIVDQANTATSRAAVMDMRATGIIEITGVGDSPAQAMEQLRRGRISAAIVLPPDYERRLIDGRPAVQVMVDGTDTVVQAAANQLAQMPLERPNGGRIAPDAPQIEVVSFYNPERRSAVSIVPDRNAAHNQLTTVVAIAPEAGDVGGDAVEAGLAQASIALLGETLN